MKLGATITSERGKAVTKTGNEYLYTTINDEYGDIIAEIRAEVSSKNIINFSYWTKGNQSITQEYKESNGNLKDGSIICANRNCTNQEHKHSWMR